MNLEIMKFGDPEVMKWTPILKPLDQTDHQLEKTEASIVPLTGREKKP